jgi:hypothetical protein
MPSITFEKTDFRTILSRLGVTSLSCRPIRQTEAAVTFDHAELDAEIRRVSGGNYIVSDDLGWVSKVTYRELPAFGGMSCPTHEIIATGKIQRSENARSARRVNVSAIIAAATRIFGIDRSEWHVDREGIWAHSNDGGIDDPGLLAEIGSETGIAFEAHEEGKDYPILCPEYDDDTDIVMDENLSQQSRMG